MLFVLYNFIQLTVSPLIVMYILYRVFVSGKSRRSWRQQLGGTVVPDSLGDRDRIWIHAVSAGESVASASVISHLKTLLPGTAVVVSTTTEAGQEMAHKSVKDADAIIYFPFDLLPCVARALRRVRPVVFASTDTEIWPNFLHLAHSRGVKTALINGTISDRTLRGATRFPWLYRWALSNIDRFCMQSEADAERVIALGADPGRVTVTGNCKADQAGEPMGNEEVDRLRASLGIPDTAPVFVAGSTNPGEDEPVLDAFLAARACHKELRLIVAPRQIERAEEISGLAELRNLRCARRSDPESLKTDWDVLILDTFGELAAIYAVADVTFVGGSLIPRGCHSILQPIAQGKPVIFGPYTFKAKDLVAQAKAAGIGFEAGNAEELAGEILRLLGDGALLAEVRQACARMMEANRGAARRTAEALAELYRQASPAKERTDGRAALS